MDKPKRRFGERAVWIAITAFLVAVLALLAFSPRVLAGNREVDNQRLLEMFAGVFADVQKNYVDEVDPKVLIDGALKGMFDALKDPYSLYLSAEEMRDMGDTTTGKFGGVGLIISKVEGGVEVVSPIEDTPAFRAGVHAGDLIVAVDGASVLELSIDQVLSILRGQPGTPVTMTVLRGKALRFDVTVVRAVIEVPTVKYAMMPDGIGYLRLIQFTPQASERTAEALRSFQAAGYRALVLDLRSNPGGLLQSAVDVANFFVARGPIVSTRSRMASENQVFYASSRRVIVPEELPVLVLVNRGSASASEILAGALQDTGRARIVGEKSYGKGSVQWVRDLGAEGYRLTISRYFTPQRQEHRQGGHPSRRGGQGTGAERGGGEGGFRAAGAEPAARFRGRQPPARRAADPGLSPAAGGPQNPAGGALRAPVDPQRGQPDQRQPAAV